MFRAALLQHADDFGKAALFGVPRRCHAVAVREVHVGAGLDQQPYDLGADLLIAGNRRKSRLYALLTGSTTLDIVRMSAITVCLVPQRQ